MRKYVTTSNPPELGSFGIESPKLPSFNSGRYSPPMPCRIIASTSTDVPLEALAPGQVVSGAPRAGALEFDSLDVPCGLWEHTAGVSTDVEADEVFVVLSGHARIDVAGEGSLTVGPGDVVHLTAGAQTTWHVLEPLRKFWIAP